MAEEIMAIRFDCPSCKAHYEVADELAGKMIMCRVCKKRGVVRGLTTTSSSAGTLAAGAAAKTTTRRNFLPFIGLFLASLGAIGVGALLARQPWERGRERPEDGPDGGRRRFRRGPGEDKKDGKESAV
jgi:hypothetical protein